MKTHRPQKRKVLEITRKRDEYMGVDLKKSVNRTVSENQSATESVRMPHFEPLIQMQVSSAKIKLQLFPINEETRVGLEKDGFNPFLELTLSRKKRISSVIRHLITKWSSSTVAKGELMLFPYNTKLEQVASCRRWTSDDSAISTWKVYVDMGSPSFFRLRYGWYSNTQQEMLDIPPQSIVLEDHMDSEGNKRRCSGVLHTPSHGETEIDESRGTIKKHINMSEALHSNTSQPKSLHLPASFTDNEVTNNVFPLHSTVPWDDSFTNLSIGGFLSDISMQGKINGTDPNSVNKYGMHPFGLTYDFSVGGLLSEASLQGKVKNPSMKPENGSSLQHIVLSSGEISMGGLFSEVSLLSKNERDTGQMQVSHAQIQSPWNDTFTNLSIGALFSESSLQAKACSKLDSKGSKTNLQANAPLSNSFDSLIPDRSNGNFQVPNPSCNNMKSILDAEETCHAFPVRKLQPNRPTLNSRASSSKCSNSRSPGGFQTPRVVKINNETISSKGSCQELRTNKH